MSLISAFETRTNVNIVTGLVKLGCYEKEGLSLALGTTSWNVVIISPYSAQQESQARSQSASSSLKKRLAINRDITAIETASFDANLDTVVIGTSTNLLAYNVETNTDIFYKDVPDGVNSILFCSELPHISNGKKQPLVIVGGNCSIQAFDCMGEEVFWTVTSDNVTAMILCDIDNDGVKELLVGSEDCTIKAFKGEQIVSSISESDVVSHLQSLGNDCYAYGLMNGTLGVYAGNNKLWKMQSKERVSALNVFNVSGTPQNAMLCLIVGWSNGLVEVRKIETGKVIWSSLVIDSTHSITDEGVAGIVCGNLRGISNDKHSQIITVSTKGVITAWIAKAKSPKKAISNAAVGENAKNKIALSLSSLPFTKSNTNTSADTQTAQMASIDDLDELESLIRERDELKDELHHLDSNWKRLKADAMDDPSLIPPNTEISCTLTPSIERQKLLLIMSTNNSTVIKSAVIYGDKVFANGCFMLVPSSPNSSITLPLSFEKDLQCNLSIKAIVGHLSSSQNHVFELSHRIPRFASYLYVPTSSIPTNRVSQSYATFVCPERINRLILWLNQAFLLEYEANSKKTIDISFVSLRNGEYLTLQCDPTNKITLRTQNVSLAGDVMEDISKYLNIKDLQSTCYFEDEFETLKRNINNVELYNDIRNKLSVDIASNTAVIKNFIVRAQDSKQQKHYNAFKAQYSDLFDINQEMISDAIKRQNNHQNLINSLKEINQIIQKMSRLRIGKYQKITVSAARKAIKNKNIDGLINALHSVISV